MNRDILDRREDVRFPVDCSVTICSEGQKRGARIIDLSCGGARIGYENSHIPAPAGAHRLRIEVPGYDPVEIVALTVWQTRFSYGAKFVIACDIDRLAVAELLDIGARDPEARHEPEAQLSACAEASAAASPALASA